MEAKKDFDLDLYVSGLPSDQLNAIINNSQKLQDTPPARVSRRRFLGISALAITLGAAAGSKILRRTSDKTPQPTIQPKTSERTPEESEVAADQDFFDNGEIRIGKSQVLSGIIDIFTKDKKTGEWIQLNNIVPDVQVAGAWRNSESEGPVVKQTLISNNNGVKEVKFQYAPLSNGAHFALIARLEKNKPEASFRLELNEGCPPIEFFSLGQYYGLLDQIHTVEINEMRFDSRQEPVHLDGFRKNGKFIDTYPLPKNGKVVYFGKSGKRYFQSVNQPLFTTSGDKVRTELRNQVWVPEHLPMRPPYQWWELVQIIKSRPTTGLEWKFGIEK